MLIGHILNSNSLQLAASKKYTYLRDSARTYKTDCAHFEDSSRNDEVEQ